MNPSLKKVDEKKELIKNIEERIKEYDLAIEYFKNNNYNEDKIKKGEEDKKLLEELLGKINSGEEIDKKIIPKEITPEYIYGYSNDERTKKYYDIIIKIIEEKNKLKTELSNEIKELKKLKESQLIAMEKDIIQDFEKIKNKKEKYDEIINILKNDFLNKWIPAPLYSDKDGGEIEVERIKEDIPENTLRIEFGKTDYLKNKKVVITAELKGTNYKEEWEQKEEGDWSHIIDWQLNKDEYKDISTKVFYFQVNEKLRGNKTKFKGEGEIALSKLNKENIFSDNFEFKLKTNRMIPHIQIEFKIRKCIEPVKDKVKTRIFCFTKFYPPFKNE